MMTDRDRILLFQQQQAGTASDTFTGAPWPPQNYAQEYSERLNRLICDVTYPAWLKFQRARQGSE